jgi:hypothetical protein
VRAARAAADSEAVCSATAAEAAWAARANMATEAVAPAALSVATLALAEVLFPSREEFEEPLQARLRQRRYGV